MMKRMGEASDIVVIILVSYFGILVRFRFWNADAEVERHLLGLGLAIIAVRLVNYIT